MTKAEIEKAIENGESVWGLCGGVYEIKLSEHSEQFFDRDNNYCYTDKNGEKHCCFLQLLYKTKAEAEHYLHHANVTRTEILPFLTWEEFDKGNRLIRFIGKNGERCKLEGYQSDDTQGGFIDVVVNGTGSHIDYDYTEENFYKAYDEAVRLFRGEQL